MPIKFVTLNIWWGGELFDNAIEFLKRENPDILSIQEAITGVGTEVPKKFKTINQIRSEFSYKYYSFAPAFNKQTKYGVIEVGNVIFSRFPIVFSQTVFFDIPYGTWPKIKNEDFTNVPRNIIHAKIDVNSSLLNIFNVHGIWGINGNDNDRRLSMGEKIVTLVKDKENTILSGDFNISPNTKTIAGIKKYLISVLKDELTTSFNKKRKSDIKYHTAVADMIFVSKEIKITNHYCPQVDVSDHLPLVTNFSF